MYEALWKPRGSKKTILLGIFGTPDPGVVFRNVLSNTEIPPEEITFVPYQPFTREWSARSRLYHLAEMDRENAEAEGREPDAGLLLALSLILGREPSGRAAELEQSISRTWCAREEELCKDPAHNEIPLISEETLLEGKVKSGS